MPRFLAERQEEEIALLAEDIKRHGLQYPVVLLEGMVLDGRARLAACELAGVEPDFTAWSGEGCPVEWCIATNVMSHRLTYSRRVVLAYDVLSLLEEKRRDSAEVEGDRAIGGSIRQSSAEDAARITRTSIYHIKVIEEIKSVRSDLVDAVRRGDLTFGEAGQRTGACRHDALPPRRRDDRFRKDSPRCQDIPEPH